MDIKLQQFVREIETLADVRNVDVRNPVAIRYDFPSLSMRYLIVGSPTEPTYQAYPINLIWVVMDASSKYYRCALQLKSRTANDPLIEDRITDTPFLGTWIEVQTYPELFEYPQYYEMSSGGGSPGPAGPAGKDGYIISGDWNSNSTYNKDQTVFYEGSSYVSQVDNNRNVQPGTSNAWLMVAQKGDSPEFDYEAVITEIVRRLEKKPQSIQIEMANTVFENDSVTIKVFLYYDNGTSEQLSLNAVDFVVTPQGSGAINKSSGRFEAGSVNADTVASVSATYDYTDSDGNPAQLTASKQITIRNIVPTSVAVNGPSSVNEGQSATFTATVTYNNGTSQAVPTAGRVWSVVNAAHGTITQNGVFTAAEVSANTTATIRCDYAEEGVSVFGTRNVTIVNVVVAQKARVGFGPAVTDFANYNSEFVNTITNTEVSTAGSTHRFSVTTGAGQYGFYAHPKSWGIVRFMDVDAPLGYGGWDGARNNPQNPALRDPYEVQATVNGVTEAWYIYRQDRPNLGTTTWDVSPKP